MNENCTDLNPSSVNIEIVLESPVVEDQQSDQLEENGSSSTTRSEESYTIDPYSETSPSTSDNQIKQKSSAMRFSEQYNITRRKIIFFSLIVWLILLIIAMVVIGFIVLKPHHINQESSTSQTNSYTDTTTGTTIPIIYDVNGGGISGGPPCSSYTVINDPLRNVAASGIGGTCDNGPLFNTSIGGRWIRFMGVGGTTISVISPGANHCGAFITGWFNGTLPSTIQTIVGGTICLDSQFETCFILLHVSVVNCGSFDVYFLPPVIICNARYCTI